MGDWPRTSGSRITGFGAVTASSDGTTITASASANTKGSWTELVSSSDKCDAVLLVISPATAPQLLDIGIGAAGSEQVLIPDLHTSVKVSGQIVSVMFPLAIAAGSRVSARLAAATGSVSATLTAHLLVGGFDAPAARSIINAYGVSAATSRGTSVDPGGTANAKGPWVQMTASTSRAHKGLVIGTGNQGIASAINNLWLVDIGIGPSGSEQVLLPNFHVRASSTGTVHPNLSPILPVSIPAGSRLAVRTQSLLNSTPGRLLDFVLYGIA